MISKIVIPSLGATGGAVVFDGWLAQPDDFVEAGAPLFVVTTDKATVEVESFTSGFVRRTFADAGSRFEPGDVIGLLSTSLAESLEEAEEVTGLQRTTRNPEPEETRIEPLQMEHGGDGSRILASPLARRMAKQAGIELAEVEGSGRRGEILRRDVELSIAAQHIPSRPVSVEQREASSRGEGIPLSPMRRAIAERTQASKSQIPHFYAAITIDMEAARAFLDDAVEIARLNGWQPPTLNDVVLRAAALSLRATIQINASFLQDSILYHPEVNIGLVVGLEDGMIVPVVHRADEKNLYTLAALTNRLKDRARKLSLSAAELTGSTFTLSNLGMYGLDSFIAVINPPEAGVLAVGAVRQAPAVRENQVVPRWQMEAILSVDHRIVDGAVAAKFMDELKRRLEKPVGLALEAPQEAE